MQQQWAAVDNYIARALVKPDSSLELAIRDSNVAGLPPINVAASQGKFLHLLARSIQAKRILEIGTLGGYSTIWLARALPKDGHLITLEVDPKHAEVAKVSMARAEVASKVELRLGLANETLAQLVEEKAGPFDLIFIDADKQNCAEYFTWALKLSRPGSLIIVDNVIRDGEVIRADSEDDKVQGVRRLYDLVEKESRVSATALQTVGIKGYDGFLIALVS